VVFIENLGFFDSGQILEMYVVLLYLPCKNTVLSHARSCAASVASTVQMSRAKPTVIKLFQI